jgi:hypothetical protein
MDEIKNKKKKTSNKLGKPTKLCDLEYVNEITQ